MPKELEYQKSILNEYFGSLVVTVILALFGTTFIVQAFKIPTPSMEQNLLVGDHLLVNKFAFGSPGSFLDVFMPYKDVKRGDIIVFKYPRDKTKHYVKRVIGLPGDHLKIVDKQVFINGEMLDEPYKVHTSAPGAYADPFRDYFPPPIHPGRRYINGMQSGEWYENHMIDDGIVVPDSQYFAMGDNRDNSADSRYWGFVSRQEIVGKALIIYWSYETNSEAYRRTSVRDRIDQFVDLGKNFFWKTRWSRMFQIIR